MKEITITYTVYEDELKAVQELADWCGRSIEAQFESMMTLGSILDIQDKIKYWQTMRENEMKKEKINLTFIGEDDFGRAVFNGSDNKTYVTTDLIPRCGWEALGNEGREQLIRSLHSRTDYGEPDCPKWREGKFCIGGTAA